MDIVEHILEEAGWYPGRKIDIGSMIEDLEREGYNLPNDLVKKLLEEYWNLELNFKTPDGKFGNIRLNIEEIFDADVRIIKKIGELLNEDLIPVGTIHFDTALLLVSDIGKFYMAANGMLYLLGVNFHNAIFTIISQADVIKIHL